MTAPSPKTTPIVGYTTDGIPMIAARRDRYTTDADLLTFWCEHCRKRHTHGGGPPGSPEGTGNGHRDAHCREGSPFKDSGYVIVEATATIATGPSGMTPDPTGGQAPAAAAESVAPVSARSLSLVRARQIDLNDVRACRRELASVYRDTRAKQLDTGDGSRLAFMLMTLIRALEIESFEARLVALEKRGNFYDAD